MSEEYIDNDFYDEEEDDAMDGEYDFDCGAMYGLKGEPLGCSMAGSEDCDWDCPYREDVERSLRAQYAAKVRWAKAKAKPNDGASSQRTEAPSLVEKGKDEVEPA
jgi:hypothetical protein